MGPFARIIWCHVITIIICRLELKLASKVAYG